jgi:hypothetical protein
LSAPPPSFCASVVSGSAAAKPDTITLRMANRTLKFPQWLKLIAKHSLDDDETTYKNLTGVPVIDVSQKLDVSRAMVYKMIDQQKLDVLHITNGVGAICVSLVTEASLERYLEQRVPDRGRQGYFAFSP